MKLYFVRHGQTNSNAGMTNSQSVSEMDEPLNELGVTQAEDLAEQLKDIKFDAIISSPLKRATQTAEIINKQHNLPIKSDSAWREREAGAYIDVNSWHVLFDFDKNIQIENSESIEQFFARIYKAIDNLKSIYNDRVVLIVSHGGVQHALFAYANRLPHRGNMRISPMKNCEYRIYEL